MRATGGLATINLHKSTAETLRRMLGGKRRSYEDVILALLVLHPPERYLKETARRYRDEREYSSEQVYREAGLR
jgi:hypothetical protein